MLHGFTGSSEAFIPIAEKLSSDRSVLLAELPGHGSSPIDRDDPNPVGSFSERLRQLLQHLKLEKVHLHGYSLGGRLAMRFAIRFPEYVQSLLLESTSAGITDDQEREDRIAGDERLAGEIENGYLLFLEKWNRLPLFKSPESASKEQYQRFGEIQVAQNPENIAENLRQFSAGRMTPVWNDLRKDLGPTLILTGMTDRKYTSMWDKFVPEMPLSRHEIIENAGHRVHLDNPNAYIRCIRDFLVRQDPTV